MARDFRFEQPIMSHDQIEVDLPTFLGERNNVSQAKPKGATFLQRLRNFTVIYIGEVPHSKIDSAFDIAQPLSLKPSLDTRRSLSDSRSPLLRLFAQRTQ